MKLINLHVEDKEFETVMTILNNLKDGLIKNIEIDGKSVNVKQTRYQPKSNKVIYEDESGTNDKSGKYLSPNEYKKRLKKNV